MSAHLPYEAEIVERVQETPDMFTWRLKLIDERLHSSFVFAPGQFNMLYLYGVGEIPVSIVCESNDSSVISHTIRVVGRVSEGMAKLTTGQSIGIRGPFGNGWPMPEALGKDVLVITGGLGCAPVVSVLNYIEHRRDLFKRLNIVQGVKHSNDLIWQHRYDHWREMPDTKVQLAADVGEAIWPWHVGPVTELLDGMEYDEKNCIVMICGPEGMIRAVIRDITRRGINASQVYISMERNMQCAVGHCGHCQFGKQFVCKNGPVFNYADVSELLKIKGL